MQKQSMLGHRPGTASETMKIIEFGTQDFVDSAALVVLSMKNSRPADEILPERRPGILHIWLTRQDFVEVVGSQRYAADRRWDHIWRTLLSYEGHRCWSARDATCSAILTVLLLKSPPPHIRQSNWH